MSAVAARKALTNQASSSCNASKGLNGNDSIEDVLTVSTSLFSGLPDIGLEAQKEVTKVGIASEESSIKGAFMSLDEDTQLPSYARYTLLVNFCSVLIFVKA